MNRAEGIKAAKLSPFMMDRFLRAEAANDNSHVNLAIFASAIVSVYMTVLTPGRGQRCPPIACYLEHCRRSLSRFSHGLYLPLHQRHIQANGQSPLGIIPCRGCFHLWPIYRSQQQIAACLLNVCIGAAGWDWNSDGKVRRSTCDGCGIVAIALI